MNPIDLNEISKKDLVYYSAAVILAIILYFGILVMPLQDKISTAQNKLNSLVETAAIIQSGVKEYLSLPDVAVVKRDSSILSETEKLAGSCGISKNINYLKPFYGGKTGEGAEIKLNGISATDLIRFLHSIQNAQIVVTRASFKDNGLNGSWDVRMFLENR